jgi:hypothetical protein
MTIAVAQNAQAASASVVLTGVTAGNTIVVFVVGGGSFSCSDTVDGSAYGAQRGTCSGGGDSYASFVLPNCSAGTRTITVANGNWVWAIEISGATSASYSTQAAQQQASPGTSADAVSSGNATPTAQPALLLAIATDDSTFASAPNAGTGFTSVGAGWDFGSGNTTRLESKRLTSTSAVPATFTATNGGGDHAVLAVVILEGTSGGPTISAQPSDTHVAAGATASFSVSASATGGGTLSYQWKFNGSNVGTNSSSYSRSSAAPSDDGGSVTCDVTETGGTNDGTVTSTAAILRVGVIFFAAGVTVFSAANGTAVAPGWPSTGDGLGDYYDVVGVGMKPGVANGGSITAPSSPWASLAALTGAGGYSTTLGADTGNCNLWVYGRVSDGTTTSTLSITVAEGGANGVAWAKIMRFKKPPGTTWSAAGVTGSDTTAGSVSVTFGSNPTIVAGDMTVVMMCIPTDVNTAGSRWSAEAVTATGCTFATATENEEFASATGNDIGGVACYAQCLTGPASAAPVFTATAGTTSTNYRGPAALIRLNAVAGGAYTLTASLGSFSLTGNAAGLIHGRTLAAISASYAVVGTSTQLSAGRRISAAQASYALTGNATALRAGRALAAAVATFAETGNALAFSHGRTLPIAVASYVETGNATALRAGRQLAAALATFTLTGRAVGLPAAHRLAAVQASYVETGVAVGLRAARRLVAAVGVFTWSGLDAGLNAAAAHTLSASSASYALTGRAAGLAHGARIAASLATFTETGRALAFSHGRTLIAAAGAYVETGNAVALRAARRLVAALGTYIETGQSVGFSTVSGHTLAAASAAFALTGKAAALVAARRLPASVGTFALAGNAAGLRAARILRASASAFALAGVPLSFMSQRELAIDVAAFIETGRAAALPHAARIATARGAFGLNGFALGIQQGRFLQAEAGDFAVTGTAVSLATVRRLLAARGDFVLTGADALIIANVFVRAPARNITRAFSGRYRLGGP